MVGRKWWNRDEVNSFINNKSEIFKKKQHLGIVTQILVAGAVRAVIFEFRDFSFGLVILEFREFGWVSDMWIFKKINKMNHRS